MAWYWDHYLGPGGNGASPVASPLRAPDLAGVAPAFVLTCEYDPLRDEGDAYARRLEQAGVTTTRRRYDGMIHGFIRMAGLVDRAHDGLDGCAAALRQAFARADG